MEEGLYTRDSGTSVLAEQAKEDPWDRRLSEGLRIALEIEADTMLRREHRINSIRIGASRSEAQQQGPTPEGADVHAQHIGRAVAEEASRPAKHNLFRLTPPNSPGRPRADWRTPAAMEKLERLSSHLAELQTPPTSPWASPSLGPKSVCRVPEGSYVL